MSLFPAYSSDKTNDDKAETWLSNSSFKPEALAVFENLNQNAAKLDTDAVKKRKSKISSVKKRSKKKKTFESIKKIDTNEFASGDFCIDRVRERRLISISYISDSSAPKYYKYSNILGGHNQENYKGKKRKKSCRYFNYIIDDSKRDEKKIKTEATEQNASTKQEEDLKQTTAFYNRTLSEDPTDVKMWLKYVQFQDMIWQFEKSYKKGSIPKGSRVTAERKLSILDKALNHNPDSEELLREKINIGETFLPSDELSVMLKSLVEKDPQSIISWQGYIEATQCSMAHCNASSVIEMYNKCLTKLHYLRRGPVSNKVVAETKILNMLYRCGLFLRQSGLWEQLWTLLRMYLDLNVSSDTGNKFNIKSNVNEKELTELEEIVLSSMLPSHELWLRIEKLRESCHWLPVSENEPCEDPQRIVFSDDVSDLIHPITTSENSFRLISVILTLLKMPLLPCRHTTMANLGIDYVPWAFDAVEMMLPTIFPLSTVNKPVSHLLNEIIPLAVGPQYLRTHPGQEEYLDFLTKIIRNCAVCLKNLEQTALYVWWLSFERILIILDKEGCFKMPTGRKKKIKSAIKELLKTEEHRNSIILYREYALFEFEQGNVSAAVTVLTTALTIHKHSSLITIQNYSEKSALCSLYRTITELVLRNDIDSEKSATKAVHILTCLVTGQSLSLDNIQISIQETNAVLEKFKHITAELLSESWSEVSISEQFLPDFFTDWLICNGWLIYLTKSPREASKFVENILTNVLNEDKWRSEVMFEWYIGMLHKQCNEQLGSGTYSFLYQVLERGIKIYPNNQFFLATIAQLENVGHYVGRPWWKINKILNNPNYTIPVLFLTLLTHCKMTNIELMQQFNLDTSSSNVLIEDSNYKYRMLNLLRNVTKTPYVSKRSGLVWRFYLKFLYQRGTPDECRKVYYAAVEECPWLKALYIDAAVYIPTELPQIQDLLVEKQLRLHFTPEELDILKS